MIDKVKRLHELRQTQAVYAESLRQSRQDWEDENAYSLAVKGDTDTEIFTLEAELKAERVEMYDGKDKSKIRGVGIRITIAPDYETKDALLWAIEHCIALKLDTRAFEKIAKSFAETDPASGLDFVTMRSVVTATIATDLSKYVGKDDA